MKIQNKQCLWRIVTSLSLLVVVGGCLSQIVVITPPEFVTESAVTLPLSVQMELTNVEDPKSDFATNISSAITVDRASLKQTLISYMKQRRIFQEIVDGPSDSVLRVVAKYELNTNGMGSVQVLVRLEGLLTGGSNLPLGRYIGKATGLGGSKEIPQMLNRAVNDALDDLSNRVEQSHGTILAKLGKPPQPTTAATAVVPTSDVDTLPSARTKPKKNAYAIVIGIEQYREKLPKADFADRDAKLVGDYLTKVMGYPEENVIVRLNERATRTDLVKYFEEWLKNNVEPGGSVFVYYSGHGAPNTKTGEAYLVPYDGDPSFVDSTAYPVKQMYAALDKLPAKDVTVVLDSCFSGAGGRSVLAKGARPMGLSIENPVLASSKTVVLAASGGDQISNSFEEKGHGLLTYFFLKGLQGDGDTNKDGVIEMAELYDYVKPNVQRIARKQYNNEQTPQLLASPDLLKKGGGRLVETTRER